MIFPMLNEIPESRSMISTFKGYNHNLRIGTGEFYDMENMTGDHYPVLSPRAPRRNGAQIPGAAQGMAALNGLCYVFENRLYYGAENGEYKTADLYLTEGEKRLIAFGAYIIVMPDKVWLNTVDGSTGSCETGEQFQASVGIVWCEADGTPFETVVESETAPENTVQMWLSGSALKEWNETLGAWTEVSPSYLKVIGDSVGALFEAGSKITFGGDPNLTAIFGTGEHTVMAKERDWIVVEGHMPYTRAELGDIQFEIAAKMPAMDFVFEHENRLWGCRYGLNNSGEFVNEIYASKPGDFKRWSSFQGISTDSYIASCGTDGKWTGAIKALGYPLFFKENYLHKVYGSYPASYQVQVTPCRGVQEGCEKSLAVVNEVLYYKSRGGVCAYDGSLPVCVSEALGNVSYSAAVAGRQGNKYYISMRDASNAAHLFCLDTQKGLWHREDGLCVKQFCTVADVLYYTVDGNSEINCIGGAGAACEQAVSWYVETGIIGADDPDRKYIRRITVRLSAALGTRIRFFAQYDSVGSWVSIGSVAAQSLSSFSVPLRLRRCDHLRLRIEGTGEAKIYALTLTTEQGSEIR